eukprot:CAMPEP_0183296860 /NCGR_PEP_ID=MMETSP0160_2-20130417/4285_1 /TAXON_ID=2839 ORGANISM="Odontella Sinensis, Strain Grunow 1884" /NCGR_SAMPLE_ID=MMETSP0160_2 /ASSEMBLY_ACC=CAM_ASM_000250 /LENGTH=345 /DNA_ID=CAMNT_0025458549 /DNA_START=81 /DNA_END=1118 /DNA_ORIENTATION=+
MPTPRDVLFSVAAAAMGASAFIMANEATKEMFEPIIEACSASGGPAMTGTDLVTPNPYVGLVAFDGLVCIITQFLHHVVLDHPAGMISWVTTVLSSLPASVIMTAEGGRTGSWGIIRYPTVMGMLFQLFGVSIMFPLVWIPGCLLLTTREGRATGSVVPRRMYIGAASILPGITLTALTFILDPSSREWAAAAGMLGGPVLVLFPLLLWGIQHPKGEGDDPKSVERGARAIANAHLITGAVGVVGWGKIVSVFWTEYDVDVTSIWTGVWVDADPAVKFMTIDALVLFLAVVLYIGAENLADALFALILFPVVGPASCSVVLWGRERLKIARTMAALKVDNGKKES